ncbi:MAG: ASCH domain-containing protein [Deltaproteobacteria bacterium]|nr:ASCH domain-containing protein [Deltaproteobacteria bacterium]
MNALLIQKEHLELILDGCKTWELRGKRTNIRGHIGLIESGSGTVVGVCELVNCEGPFSVRELRENAAKLCRKPREVVKPYKKTYAWVLADAKRVQPPVAYEHPRGAVIWVKLKEPVARQIIRRIADA